ncbi:MAG TPA: glycosyl hydrolase family 8 [Geminicoccus sp.]|jgi:endoglucanase|uniref:glycosyl hydrolase family 8 n=1 Tax=Geminicoccus sp. TaxID=2024832 RepID=UPI002E2EEE62|nr:glycosyl hydrolase family 8 [Geminicoccus sp.]HEX2527908.1 glycosyl hydrolase family 8 [Geminicoccus sp.]
MSNRRDVVMAMSGFLADLTNPLRAVSSFMRGTRPSLPAEEWQAWCAHFLDGGRVVDTGNGGVSHTEGQGYGMLLAVASDDEPAYDAMLDWTVRHLPARDDGLLSWRYDPRRPDDPVADPNAATDGDLLIAWALLRGGARWERPELTEQGLVSARAVRLAGTVEHAGMRVLLPGPEGFKRPDGPVVNLSYWVFPALRALAAADPHPDWPALISSGRRLATSLRFGSNQLPPDWALLAEPPRPASGFPAVFGYNALRIPLYVAWSEPDPLNLVAPILSLWDRAGATPPSVVALDASGTMEAGGAVPGINAIRATLRYLRDGTAPLFPTIRNETDYYAATLVLLARLAFDEVSRP